jgi:hypothetical protein
MVTDRGAQETVPVRLTAFGAAPASAAATVLHQGAGQRTKRALTGLGMFWGPATLAVFIPVGHFILVPTLLVGGIVFAAVRLRENDRLVAVRGSCPRCHAEQDFPAGGRFRSGCTIDCPRCHTRLTLNTDDAGRASSTSTT